MIRRGLQIPSFTYPDRSPAELFEHVSDIARTAEDAGFDAVFVMDHFFQLPMLGRPDAEMLEAYTLLSALAARTSRVKLGALVGGVTYRNPALLAKQVTTLDVISAGRAIWGIGAGWFEQEHVAYGIEFGTFTERFEKLEEALQIVTSMFRNHTTSFEGKWFTVRDAFNTPPPVQEGGPKVLIGGSGERKTLRLVAQYGDACNLFGSPDVVRHKLAVLDDWCAKVGRDPAEITRTRLGTLVLGRDAAEAEAKREAFLAERGMSWATLPDSAKQQMAAMYTLGGPDDVTEQVQAYVDAGCDGLIFNLPDAYDLGAVAFAGEVLAKALPDR
jgi:F420-dependent oxidoreductase-like protein